MDKSTLEKCISSSSWLCARLRAENAVNCSILQALAALLGNGSRPAGVIFDDYTPEEVDENLFGGLVYSLRAHGIPFMVTTSKALPSRISAALGLLDTSTVQVRGLSNE